LASGLIIALKDEGVLVGTVGRTVGVAIGVGRAPRCERRVGGKDAEEEGQGERKTAHGGDGERGSQRETRRGSDEVAKFYIWQTQHSGGCVEDQPSMCRRSLYLMCLESVNAAFL
jgi:hypothetical protein